MATGGAPPPREHATIGPSPPLQPGARLSIMRQLRANTPLAQTVECAALIVGSGASGIASAISAALAGLEVEATRKAV